MSRGFQRKKPVATGVKAAFAGFVAPALDTSIGKARPVSEMAAKHD